MIALGQFDYEVIRHQRTALRHDRRSVIHLALHGASDFDRL